MVVSFRKKDKRWGNKKKVKWSAEANILMFLLGKKNEFSIILQHVKLLIVTSTEIS